MKSFSSRKFAAVAAALAGIVPASFVAAQTFTETQPLSFGKIAIVSAGAVGRVTIDPSGSYSTNSNVYLHTPPQLGEYSITGGPPSTVYTITLPSSVSIAGPGGPFTLDNLEVRPVTLVTDAAGDDTFTISGRLQTLGGGTVYNDGNYSGTFIIMLNF